MPGTGVVDPFGSVSVQWYATVTGPLLTLIVAANAGPWLPEVAAAGQGPIYVPRSVCTETEITGGTLGLVLEDDGVGLVLEGDGEAVGSGGGAGRGRSTVFSMLLGVTEGYSRDRIIACNRLRPVGAPT